jgi:hypothetical protein
MGSAALHAPAKDICGAFAKKTPIAARRNGQVIDAESISAERGRFLTEEKQRRERNAQDHRPHYCDLTTPQVAQWCQRLLGLDAHDELPSSQSTGERRSRACSNLDTAPRNPGNADSMLSISLHL